MVKLAAVIVHYRTPELLGPACEALIDGARAAGVELEGLVVDNGSRPQDRAHLAALPFRCLEPGQNLGYAGGANLGLRQTEAEFALVMNPDVVVLPGCLAALVAALEGGAAAAGPRFYWDHGRRFQLPPTEPVSRRSELLRLAAARGGRWAVLGRRRWRRHAHRHWLAETSLRSYDLSGALLALRRSAWQQVGPFDEGYRLYFEETDWLQRLRRSGAAARFVPAAAAVHLYAQSVPRQDRAAAWFLESNRRFRRRVFGRPFTRFLELLDRLSSPRRDRAGDIAGPRPASAAAPAAWLEVSPSPIGFPAAGHRLQISSPTREALPPSAAPSGSDLPEEIWQRLAAGSYFLRTVDASGRDLSLTVVDRNPPQAEAPGRRPRR